MAKDRQIQMVDEKQLADMLGMSLRFIRAMRSKPGQTPGKDPLPFHKLGKSVRYSLRDVADWLERRRAYDGHEASRLKNTG